MTRVIIRHNEDGNTILADGEVEVLEIDENAPHDRVYRRKVTVVSPADLDRIIGDGAVGHANDARHEAVAHRVEHSLAGKSHLRPVDDEQ